MRKSCGVQISIVLLTLNDAKKVNDAGRLRLSLLSGKVRLAKETIDVLGVWLLTIVQRNSQTLIGASKFCRNVGVGDHFTSYCGVDGEIIAHTEIIKGVL